MVAKHMRCSVKASLRYSDEEFEQAYIAAAAINKARPHIVDREIEKAEKKKKRGSGS